KGTKTTRSVTKKTGFELNARLLCGPSYLLCVFVVSSSASPNEPAGAEDGQHQALERELVAGRQEGHAAAGVLVVQLGAERGQCRAVAGQKRRGHAHLRLVSVLQVRELQVAGEVRFQLLLRQNLDRAHVQVPRREEPQPVAHPRLVEEVAQ